MLANSSRLRPAELIVDEENQASPAFRDNVRITGRPPWHFDLDSANRLLCSQFKTQSLAGFGCDDFPRGVAAAGALLQYVNDTQKTALPHLTAITVEQLSDAVIMDGPTRRNLELEESLTGHHEHTLSGVMDRCMSAMGSRLLKRWIQRPIRDAAVLKGRYQAVEALVLGGHTEVLQEKLQGIGDVERIFVARRAPLCPSTGFEPAGGCTEPRSRPQSTAQAHRVAPAGGLAGRNQRATATNVTCCRKPSSDNPPVLIRDGGVIAEGFDDELDELRAIANNADQYLLDLEAREKERTGVSNLKLGYNRVHGYYIEISKSQASKAPDEYVRRQTLKSAEPIHHAGTEGIRR